MKYYSPTGRRNYGKPLKRLLDTWDRNGSTSGPTPWKIYEDDDECMSGDRLSSLRFCHGFPQFPETNAGVLTYSMVQSPSWAANWFAASQEIPRISRNPKVHYRTHKRPPPVSILAQSNPVHMPTSHLLEIHPNIIHPSTPRSPRWCFTVKPIKIFPHFPPVYNLHVTVLFIAVCLKSRQHKALISKPYVRFEVSAAAIVKVTVLWRVVSHFNFVPTLRRYMPTSSSLQPDTMTSYLIRQLYCKLIIFLLFYELSSVTAACSVPWICISQLLAVLMFKPEYQVDKLPVVSTPKPQKQPY
jgi:hypothetical protein